MLVFRGAYSPLIITILKCKLLLLQYDNIPDRDVTQLQCIPQIHVHCTSLPTSIRYKSSVKIFDNGNASRPLSVNRSFKILYTSYIVFFLSTIEYEELKSYIPDYEVYRFIPTRKQLEELGDGSVTIIDQWIAAHAR